MQLAPLRPLVPALAVSTAVLIAAPSPSPPSRPDPFMGEYAGTYRPEAGEAEEARGYVIGRKAGFLIVLSTRALTPRLEPAGTPAGVYVELAAAQEGPALPMAGTYKDQTWAGSCDGKTLLCRGGTPPGVFELTYTVRTSPTLGRPPPEGAVVLLRPDTAERDLRAHWTNQSWKLLPDGSMQVAKGANYTRRPIGDMQMHVEFMVPYEPQKGSQGRGNSGLYIQDRYELQILDSFGLVPANNHCASIYKTKAPDVNASTPPMTWQTYDITFRAATFTADRTLASPPEITVVHNGIKVHDRVTLQTPTGAGRKRHKAQPHTPAFKLQLQDHAHPVRFRNIWYTAPE